jgi:4a-hydroxytetrahydrobiopterin dehydratase
MSEVVTADALAAALRGLPGWAGDVAGIERTVTAPTFPAAIDIVVDVARAAEAADHHPDVDIRWRRVRFVLTTHSVGGVTGRDLTIAAEIDRVAAAHGAS